MAYKRFFSENSPCLIIAEIGVNHNGSLDLAKKLIDRAKLAGADAVKFQTFKTKDLVVEGTPSAEYTKTNLGKNLRQEEILKSVELTYDDFLELKRYCDERHILFLSTPHSSLSDVDFLDKIVPFHKVSSGDLTNHPLLEHISKTNKPIILSTGMSYLNEVKEAVRVLKKGNKNLILLHCTSEYPTPASEVNMNCILTLKKLGFTVGYSDHTRGPLASIMAVTLGAKVIEKHFTLSRKLPGVDQRASMEPEEFEQMVLSIRRVEEMLGSFEKKPTKSEEKTRMLARKSIFASREIPINKKITSEDICLKRPGNYLEPQFFKKIMGKKAKKNFSKDEPILLEYLQ